MEVAKNIPQDHVQQRTVEDFEDEPVLQTIGESVANKKDTPQERVRQRTDNQEVDVPVPQVAGEMLEQVVDGPSLQTAEQVVEVAKTIPQDRDQHRTVEKFGDAHSLEKAPQVLQVQVQEGIVQRRVEQIDDASRPQAEQVSRFENVAFLGQLPCTIRRAIVFFAGSKQPEV